MVVLHWASILPAIATVAASQYPLDRDSDGNVGRVNPTKASDNIEAETSPRVELPYETHQAIVNDNHGYYNFSNIPYAETPVGDLRFAEPRKRTTKTKGVNHGTEGRICHQQQVAWVPEQLDFIKSYSLQQDLSPWTKGPPDFSKLPLPDPDPRSSEDCLLLDVVVPKEIWEKRNDKEFYPAPVMVWIHGGGFIFGDKNQFGSPVGLFDAAANGSTQVEDGIIYVTLNYRLGAFGWLSSPEFIKEGGTPNAGLLDQREALRWVQENIHLFGGDPKQVTVFGESSGASSILHHLTSYGGHSDHRQPEFRRAILQSPAFFPQADNKQEQNVYERFLKLSGKSNLRELRRAKEEDLRVASAEMIFRSPYGGFTFGPAVDDSYVKAPPGLSLYHGDYWPNVEVLVSQNSDEGLLFTPPYIQNNTAFRDYVVDVFPGLDEETLEYITQDLYPPPKSSGDRDEIRRTAEAVAELAVTCNTLYILNAYGKKYSYKYLFDMVPGIHGQDAAYTYYQGPPALLPPGVTKGRVPNAHALQTYLTSYAKFGNPNVHFQKLHEFPNYKNNDLVRFYDNLAGQSFIETQADRTDVDRCRFWEYAPYYEPDSKSRAKESAARAAELKV